MRFRHTAVLQLSGITYKETRDLPLVNDEARSLRAWISAEADVPCADADRSGALGNMMLRFFSGGGPTGSFEERLAAETEFVQRSRQEKRYAGPFLVVVKEGVVPEFDPGGERETDELVIQLDGAPKEGIRADMEPTIASLVAAVSLVSVQPLSVRQVCRSTIFFREDGEPVYSFTPEMSGKLSVSTPMSSGASSRVAGLFEGFLTHDLEKVVRLHLVSLAKDDDPLRAFLASWMALEIFVHRVFPSYEHLVSDPSAEDGDATKTRHDLATKFSAIVMGLAPDADADVLEFRRVKKVRDRLSHGQESLDAEHPFQGASRLLVKYLRLHVEGAEHTDSAIDGNGG